MSQFVEKLKQYDDFMALDGITMDKIKEAEETLGVKFAKEYKEYLMECGTATADGHEFTGICKSKRLNVVSVTEKERDKVTELPDGAYVVEQTHIDGIVIWQTADGTIYQTQGKSIKKIKNSLVDYVG